MVTSLDRKTSDGNISEISLRRFRLGSVVYFHSALISITVTDFAKKKLGGISRFYRLSYSCLLVAFVFSTIPTSVSAGLSLGRTPGVVQSLPLGAFRLSVVAGGMHYCWSSFWAISQFKAGRAGCFLPDSSTFVVSGIHRIIRDPYWYMLIVWAQGMSTSTILINMVISVYFIVGSFLEERKLVLEFGEKYQEYQRTVSMLFPWRWLKT